MSQKDNVINVLDHGHIRLVSYMQPAVPDEDWTGDLETVRNARVSYDAEMRTGADEGKDEKLVNYLLKNHHTSPLESMTFTFDIKCPIFVARQWHRHRTWSFNEVSARYSQLPAEMYVPDPTLIGVQSNDNKQMREVKEGMTLAEIAENTRLANIIKTNNETSYAGYQMLIDKGVPRELARGVLPMNIYTHYFGTVNLNNLFKFINLRDHSHAQYEIQVYAKAMLELIEPIVPMNVAAFRKHVLPE